MHIRRGCVAAEPRGRCGPAPCPSAPTSPPMLRPKHFVLGVCQPHSLPFPMSPSSCCCCCHAGVPEFSSAVRLTGGSRPYQGSVEVLYNGVWLPLCSDNFDRFAATIVCQQLGYERGPLSVDNGLYPGVGWTDNTRMYLNGTCQSDSPTLLGCASYFVAPWAQCCGCDAAGVTCNNST